MNDDDLERQLRTQAGPREHGYRPIPLPATPASSPRPSRLAGTSRVALVGATVIAGAALALVLTNMPQAPSDGVGSGGSAESSPSAQPTAEPTTPPQPAACTAEDFAWSTDPWSGAAGSRGTNVLLRGVTSLDTCRLDGEVSVEIRDTNGQPLVSGTANSHLGAAAGELFEIGISWSNWCSPDPGQPLSAVLQLPGDGTDVPLIPSSGEVLIPPCNGEAQPTNLSVTDIQPSDRAFAEG